MPQNLVRRLGSSIIVCALMANAFDGCLLDLGTPAAAMACCDHERDGCTDALEAANCCKTQNAGTRIADASTILVARPVALPVVSHVPIAFRPPDLLRGVRVGDSAPAEDSPPGPSPPLAVPLRI